MITVSDIKTEGLSGILDVLQYETHEKVNEHAEAYLKLHMDDNCMNVDFVNQNRGKEMRISAQGKKLFCGYIAMITVHISSSIQIAEVKLVSYSMKLDQKKVSRSFQDTGATYANVANQAAATHAGTVKWDNTGSASIQFPIFEYMETDWEFVKRIASSLNQTLIPSVYQNFPKIEIDVAQRSAKKIQDYKELAYGISDAINQISEDISGTDQKKYEFYKIEYTEDYPLGSQVEITDGSYFIVEKVSKIVESTLKFTYTLSGKNLLSAKESISEKLCGLQLGGTIIGVKEDKVKVHLDIDKEQSTSGAYFFDWYPETSNIFYCMPEQGERVTLDLGKYNGKKAFVMNCIRGNGSQCPDTVDPLKKNYTYGNKKMNLFPEELSFIAGASGSFLNEVYLKDADGIILQSLNSIHIKSGNTITIKSKNSKIQALSPYQISVKDTSEDGATISVNKTIECDGENVEIEATVRIAFSPIADAPVVVKKDWGKLLKKALFALAVIAVVAVVAAVVTVATGGAALAAIGAVCATAAIGGAVCAGITVGVQMYQDNKNGIKRSFGDYLYQGLDAFCTGAMVTAPMALPLPLPFKLMGVGMSSFGYQLCDGYLDSEYGRDFYDEDSNIVLSVFFDVLFAGLGEGITNTLKKGVSKAVQKLSHVSKADAVAFARMWNKLPFVKKLAESGSEVNSVTKAAVRAMGDKWAKVFDSKWIKYLILGGTESIPGADLPTSVATDTNLNPILKFITDSLKDVTRGEDDYDESYSKYKRIAVGESGFQYVDIDKNGNLVFE